MARLSRGEIWMYEFRPPDKRRPVLILTRQQAISLLSTVTVAPITSQIRGAPGEVLLGPEVGLKTVSVAALDKVQTVDKSRLTHFIGTLSEEKMAEACEALAIALGCAHT